MVRTLKLFTQTLTAIALLAGSTHARGEEDELPPYAVYVKNVGSAGNLVNVEAR